MMFVLLNVLGVSYWGSTFIGNTTGACVSFFLNRSFTFKSGVSCQKGLPRFFVIILVCYFSSYFISEKMIGMFGYVLALDQGLAQNSSVLLGSGFYTLSNYVGQKYVVFRKMTAA